MRPSYDKAAIIAATRAFIAAHIDQQKLGVPQIANGVGVSRATLQRLLASDGGVAEFLWSVRLALAHERFSDPANSEQVKVVAKQLGFCHSCDLTHAFKRKFGTTPRGIRKAAALTRRC